MAFFLALLLLVPSFRGQHGGDNMGKRKLSSYYYIYLHYYPSYNLMLWWN